jgi:hypothetical protein
VQQRDRQEDGGAGPEERHQDDLCDRPRLDLVRAHRIEANGGAGRQTRLSPTYFEGTYKIELDDPAGTENDVAVTTVTSPGGLPDLVIGDTAAGIPDPVPSPCQRVDTQILRCPLMSLSEFRAFLGAGNDTYGMGFTQDIDAAALQLYTAYMGPGKDRVAVFSCEQRVNIRF